MSDMLKLTQPQASDVEAASEVIYSEAADAVIDTRTLGRDLLALALIFFVVVCYHVQNPLLKENTQFGSAFRNASLQVVMLAGLAICAFTLIRIHRGTLRAHPLRLGAAVVLTAYTLVMALAILFGINIAGALVGLPPEAMTARLNDESPVALLEQAILLPTILEYLALVGVVLLWQPWTRLAVYQRGLRRHFAPLVVGVVTLVIWEVIIDVLRVQQFLLPKPSVIGATFLEVYPAQITAGWVTFQNAFWGFVIGCGAGLLSGVIAARFISFSKALLPLAIALNAVPILGMVPIFNNWFGIAQPTSKILIAAVLCYFPVLISTVRGLTSVDALSLELMRTYGASEMEIFRKLRLPSALPFIFSALKLATTLAVIAAIVSEYYGGPTTGLGIRLLNYTSSFDFEKAWSAIVVGAVYGILFFTLVSVVERSLMPWHISLRER